MGKSGGRKKKGGSNQVPTDSTSSSTPNVNGVVDLDSSIFLRRAHELKEEGNKRFQNKDYVGALEQYDNALRLTPKTHPDRAVFHSNRAACLMQMKPIDYDTVITECSMALQVQPRFVRALLRRARAFEAIGKYEMAMQDVQVLLGADPNHRDALEIARRLRTALGPRQEAQQDLQSRPSPAALGASAVRGAPIAGLGPCLPARPVSKKATGAPGGSIVVPSNNKAEKSQLNIATENGHESKTQLPKVVLKPLNGSSKGATHVSVDSPGQQSLSSSVSLPIRGQAFEAANCWRPLKLVYDHDIRLGQMPVNCSFKVLREIVSKRFPSSNSVLIKYKDSDGDLVTITSTAELRLAESSVDSDLPKDLEATKTDSVGMLRLHIVEVSPEQEPPLLEEEEEKPLENEEKGDESGSHSSLAESVLEAENADINKPGREVENEKSGSAEDPECKEVEMDDWLFEFAQLFRTHVGIDPDAHIDLHELGMELCSEALEETVTSEEAQGLFDKAASKFQEVAALAFFNWGNVHMCAARKRIPLDESAGKDLVAAQLQVAYDWVKEKYSLAREKYEEALLIKPDFYEGLLALGQQQFEMAKLHWSFALAKKIDLSGWDPTETLQLFGSAEEKMKAATEMWEKLEQQRLNDLKDPKAKKEESSKRRKKQGNAAEGEFPGTGGSQGEISADEAAEQAAVMRSQIHLFWGNMLFERSQVECKLGLDGWDYPLPASALTPDDYYTVKVYLQKTNEPLGEILKSETTEDLNAPVVAEFSSRGPNTIVPEILKPDLTAPGVNILAAFSPLASPSRDPSDNRRVNYSILSGTSMSCPHVSGAAAYIKTFHPDWSPSAIKSALMTTARSMAPSKNADAEFAYGSGHISPLEAVDPGLLYEAGKGDYIKMLCALGYNSSRVKQISGDNSPCPEGAEKSSVRDLNYPSMAVKIVEPEKPFWVLFQRTVTNVGHANSTYSAIISSNLNINVTVVPEILSFKSLAEKKSFNVTVSGKKLEAPVSASLIWSDSTHHVRSPIVVYRDL